MATMSSHKGGEGESKEERDASILRAQYGEKLQNPEEGSATQANSGVFSADNLRDSMQDENTRVILIIGPTGAGKTTLLKLISEFKELSIGETLQAGTPTCYCLSVKFHKQNFVFIDTPGFGYQGETKNHVKSLICSVVGLFTRELGGIHGILYVRDIREERITTGDHDSLAFLREIAPPTKPNQLLDRLAFVTSHWDTMSVKSLRKAENRETELLNETWSEFLVGQRDEAGTTLRLQVDLGKNSDPPETIQEERKRVVREILNRYGNPGRLKLNMPFIGTNAAKITIKIVEGVLVITLSAGLIVMVISGAVAVGVYVIPPAFKFILKYGYIVSDGGKLKAGIRFSG